ncbi:leucine efflux protein LeuE [Nocardioides limicola]|uniref:leucine efflux protein LeuE n=1 Tax=Nocardioides limicola TaxID=2803368 RepID=UPI00193B5C8F|nr:leucine efflux protein LeuE [Nocardioides sp. DJM-14]
MLGVINLPTYLVGLVLIILLPGPNSLYVLSVAARRGVGTGYRAAMGVFTGDAVLMALSAGGVASLLQVTPGAFAVIKFLGAGYLGWLALGMLRAALATWRGRREVVTVGDTPPPASIERPYRRALVISLLNPKAILFFVAFFVQFVDPTYPNPVVSFLVLATFAQAASLAYLSLLIFGGARLAAGFRTRHRTSALATAGVGAIFIAFAVKLSVASAG